MISTDNNTIPTSFMKGLRRDVSAIFATNFYWFCEAKPTQLT